MARKDNANALANSLIAALEVNSRAISLADRAISASEVLLEMVKNQPLSADMLIQAAKAFPQWKIDMGIRDGEAFKTFTRSLDDMPYTLSNDRETYLNLCDTEYFDTELLQIFGSWSGSGDLGSFPHISITAKDVGPITVEDIRMINTAEDYMLNAGYVLPPAKLHSA